MPSGSSLTGGRGGPRGHLLTDVRRLLLVGRHRPRGRVPLGGDQRLEVSLGPPAPLTPLLTPARTVQTPVQIQTELVKVEGVPVGLAVRRRGLLEAGADGVLT